MEELRDSCSPWVTLIGQHKESGEKYEISIVLKDGALGFSFLQITSLLTNEFCIFPVSRLINFKYNSRLLILSPAEETWRIIFLISDDLECLISQFRLCSSISEMPEDKFIMENFQFLQKLFTDGTSIYKDLRDVFETPVGAVPCTTFPQSRQTWEQRCYALNQPFFTKVEDITIAAMTWNIASKLPCSDMEDDFIVLFSLGAQIIFITFEEIDMGAKAIVSGQSNRNEQWDQLIHGVCESLGYNYVFLQRSALGGIYSVIMADEKFQNKLHLAPVRTLRLGAYGLAANKGANVFSFAVGLSSFTCIGCHLSAGKEKNDQRKQQLKQILSSFDSDFIIIEGDMNFRTNLNRDQVEQLINHKEISQIYSNDQLQQSKSEFPGLYEPPITFHPTYKYDIGTDTLDSSPKRAVPSFTDRILVQTKEKRWSVGCEGDQFCFETDIIQSFVPPELFSTQPNFSHHRESNYPSPPHYDIYQAGISKISDHRPVRARLTFHIPFIDQDKFSAYEQMQMKKLDELTRVGQPQLTPSEKELALVVGDKYELVLSNNSCGWAPWTINLFSPSLENPLDVIKIEPQSGLVYPDETITIEITANAVVEGNPILLIQGTAGAYCALELSISDKEQSSTHTKKKKHKHKHKK